MWETPAPAWSTILLDRYPRVVRFYDPERMLDGSLCASQSKKALEILATTEFDEPLSYYEIVSASNSTARPA